ncbi:small nuclear ribonucleo protein polypeptide B [Thamnocephalis sphaerospora]|uniref:Small nuclear ribonucleo protein polypeptide B n=1 Tax=Thamnocephalis sphaerospora TaxID=78915 RepID=A0A4V1IW23_9FUNG|nr:small nuclear ribonucleo protein polypeptide B [Thamnocephalis sphaerospora]|eukprot:RKP06059.1 small nuclear ribonucleo protein polypeptide B [Thamnocephalis sphaerospora]
MMHTDEPLASPVGAGSPNVAAALPEPDPAIVGQPNHTLYVKNLNEKVKLPVLKKSLQTVFEQYGSVLDIQVKRALRMRGQAFIVFKELEDATKALREVQSFPLYNKPMVACVQVIAYAHQQSDMIAKMGENYEEHKRRREEEKARTGTATQANAHRSRSGTRWAICDDAQVPDELLPPNQILFVQKLPAEVTEEMLISLFQQYPGYKEVRLVPTRADIAFVEYETEMHAVAVKEVLHGYHIVTGHPMRVTFARK